MRSVQSGLTDWKWPVVIGWAACVAPAQVGGQASVHWNASLVVRRLWKADAGI